MPEQLLSPPDTVADFRRVGRERVAQVVFELVRDFASARYSPFSSSLSVMRSSQR
jgi:hypothetical protein